MNFTDIVARDRNRHRTGVMSACIASACILAVALAIAPATAGDPEIRSEPVQIASAASPAYGSTIPGVIRVPTLQDISAATAADDVTPPLEISAGEAQQWVLAAGYASVSPLELARTAEGAPVYHGTATLDGAVYAVIVDAWGNIAGWQ